MYGCGLRARERLTVYFLFLNSLGRPVVDIFYGGVSSETI